MYPIDQIPVQSWRDYFRPRWIILDTPKTCRLYSAYFWTRRGAVKARKAWLSDLTRAYAADIEAIKNQALSLPDACEVKAPYNRGRA